jgi:threonine synthase
MSIWRWAEWLDPVPESARVTLGEGNTPLVRSRRLGPAAGLRNLYLKLDFATPTGSYKDRFAAAAVSHMSAAGQSRCFATSSGNTGSALAAYCAAAGIECRIAIAEAAPDGKLQQMLAYGAKLSRVRGFGFDPTVSAGVMETVKRLGSQPGAAVQISAYAFSPLGMSGVKTLSYEIAEQLGGPVGHVFVPAGGGGMVVAVGRGFADLVRAGKLARSPRVEVVQPAGNDTMATSLRDGTPPRPVTCTTKISGLQIPNVIDGALAIECARAFGGTGHLVTDEEVWDTQRRLAVEEGVFCEPAAATALAGALKAAREGRIEPDAPVVCCVTGSGFKDPPSVARMLEGRSCPTVELDEFARMA